MSRHNVTQKILDSLLQKQEDQKAELLPSTYTRSSIADVEIEENDVLSALSSSTKQSRGGRSGAFKNEHIICLHEQPHAIEGLASLATSLLQDHCRHPLHESRAAFV